MDDIIKRAYENRPYKKAEMYLIADIIKVLFIVLTLAALFGPIYEELYVLYVQVELGTVFGLITLVFAYLCIGIVTCLVIGLSISEMECNYSCGVFAEAIKENELDIEEIKEQIKELEKELEAQTKMNSEDFDNAKLKRS